MGGRERLKASLICQVKSQAPNAEHLIDPDLSAIYFSVQPLRKTQWLHPESAWVQTQETCESMRHQRYHKHWGIREAEFPETACPEGRITGQPREPAWFKHKLDHPPVVVERRSSLRR